MSDLSTWLENYYGQAYKTAYFLIGNKSDAEEAVQDAFLRAWRFRDAIEGKDVSSIRPWLYRVLVNACNSKLRSEIPRRDRRAESANLDQIKDDRSSPTFETERSELVEILMESLAKLPEHLRATVVLRYFLDLSEKEIAKAIGRRPGTVKSRLNEAKQRMSQDSSLQQLAKDWIGPTYPKTNGGVQLKK